jgi:serine O-acetyltransferase
MDFADKLAAEVASAHAKHLGEGILHPDYLPDKDDVETSVELLRRILFPGYYDEGETAICTARNLIADVESKLRRQICRALNLEAGEGVGRGVMRGNADADAGCGESHGKTGAGCSAMYEKAGATCRKFLERLPAVLDMLLRDVEAAFEGDPAAQSKHEVIFAYPGFFAICVYRLARELHLLKVPLIPRMMTEYAHSKTGVEIHPGADIGSHFFIDHGTGVVIGETTEIGAYVKVYQGVTLGALSTRGGQSLRGKKRHPTLEDEVTVYSGATILGGETVIGKGSVIGGNSFLIKSVPPGSKVYQS